MAAEESNMCTRIVPAVNTDQNPEEIDGSFLYVEDITENEDKITYRLRWVVRDYAKIVEGRIYRCHHIRIGETIHNLRLMKLGTNLKNGRSKKYSFFLGLTPSTSCSQVSFTLTGKENKEIPHKDEGTLEQLLVHQCFSEFSESRLPREYTDLPSLCKITVAKSACVSVVIVTGTVIPNFKDLYDSDLFSDAKICVAGKEFNVHKSVLAVRSPVFLAMLQNEMKEKSENRIEIEDSDKMAVAELLRYLYYGETIPLTVNLALDLFGLADKYDVPTLRLETTNYLRCNFSVDNILDILVAADLHNEKVLKSEAIEFVSINLWCLLQSPKWKTFRTRVEIVDCILAYLSYSDSNKY